MARKATVILGIEPGMAKWDQAVRKMRGDVDGIKKNADGVLGGGGRGGGRGTAGGAQEPRGFGGSFAGAFSRAGGFGGALATVVKYGMAYRIVDGLTRSVNYMTGSVNRSIDAWMQYEEAMAGAARTMRQAGMSTQYLKGMMGREALDFTRQYRASVDDVAQSMYELGSANFDVSEILQAYQVPLKVNIALTGNITQTTRLLTQMLKIHGKQMGDNLTTEEKMIRIGGILYKTWDIEQMELSDLASAYKYVAGNAAVLGIKVEELIPLLGFLSTYGLRGSIGGTGTNQMLMQLSRTFKVTEDGVRKLQKAVRGGMHEITLDLKPGVSGPLEVLAEVGKAMAAMGDDFESRLAVAGVVGSIFNIRGARPAQLLSDLDRLGQLLKNVGDMSNASTDELEKMFEAGLQLMQNTPTAQLEIMSQKLRAIGVDAIMAASNGVAHRLAEGTQLVD